MEESGDWMMPFEFHGGAEYSQDFDLWLGFSRESPHHLCWTSELSAMVMDKPPELQHGWQDLVVPENWLLTDARLVNLGSGKFCIAKHFEIDRAPGELGYYYCTSVRCRFAVLTGVEIGRGAEGLKALKHKSILYEFMDDPIQLVL